MSGNYYYPIQQRPGSSGYGTPAQYNYGTYAQQAPAPPSQPQYQTSTPQWQVQPGTNSPSWHPQRPLASAAPNNYPSQATYNPNTYGPMSPISPMPTPNKTGIDTSRWGVKYNLPQGPEPPPLPPRNQYQSRPSSVQASVPPVNQWQGQYPQDGYSTSSQQDQTYSWNQTQAQNQYQAQQVPIPPPRPSEYQQGSQQQQWQPQYSTHPQSHNYEPQKHQQIQEEPGRYDGNTTNYSGQISGTNYYEPGQQVQMCQYEERPSVSPIEHDNIQWEAMYDPRYRVSPAPPETDRPPAASPKPTEASLMDIDTSTKSSIQQPALKTSAQGRRIPSDWEEYGPTANVLDDLDGSNHDATTLTGGSHHSSTHELASENSTSRILQADQNTNPGQYAGGQFSITEHNESSRFSSEPHEVNSPVSLVADRRDVGFATDTMDAARLSRMKSVPSQPQVLNQLAQTEIFDGDVQSWNKPFEDFKKENTDVDGEEGISPRSHSRPGRLQAPLLPEAAEAATAVRKHIVVDPYSDLEPEYRASLSRFARMLRKESQATTDDEKFKIFSAFQAKEAKLRTVLYSLDEEPVSSPVVAGPINNSLLSQHKDSSRAPPEPVVQNAKSGPSLQEQTMASQTAAVEAAAPSANSPRQTSANSVLLQSTSLKAVSATPMSNEESYVLLEGAEEGDYSPGGRPRFRMNHTVDTRPLDNTAPKVGNPAPSALTTTISPGANAPMVANERHAEERSPGADAPILVEAENDWSTPNAAPVLPPSKVAFPRMTPPPRPVYTPFRYNEGPHRSLENLAIEKSAPKAYSDLRRVSMDSGRAVAQAAALTAAAVQPELPESAESPSKTRREHGETFLGLIREKSVSVRNGRSTPSGLKPGRQTSSTMSAVAEHDIVDGLHRLLPEANFDDRPANARIESVQRNMAKYPEDFRFIHDAVLTWDRGYKSVRAHYESERHKRQEDSEHRIDGLFNEKEIGYSDISTLEEEFKQAEAERQLEENRKELESFIEDVFTPVSGRLNEEIVQLSGQYRLALDLLDSESISGARWLLDDGAGKARLSQAMANVLQLYDKVQARYQKRFEALLERERRKRKVEVGSLYSSGYVQAMKTLEADFELAERRNVVLEAKEKDDRANRLLDAFDRAIVQGLGENQTSIDEIQTRIGAIGKAVKDGETLPGDIHGPYGLRELLAMADVTLNFLSSDSASVLRSFDRADHLLNNADYDVSVAEAKVAGADSETYRKLEAEKRKEDDKIEQDTDARMATIEKIPNEALENIKAIVAEIGSDPEHQDRIRKALEEAKQRNLAKETGI